jgi:hypothetical protein
MKRVFGACALLASLWIPAGTAQAGIAFRAVMTHDQEVASPGVPFQGSSGIATFFLNDAQTRLTYDVQLTGLDLRRIDPLTGNPNQAIPAGDPNDDVLRLHIHRALVGANGAIVFGMIDANAGLRNDISPNNLIIDANTLHITGAWDLLEGANNNSGITLGTELANLLGGGLYINVHTSDHAGGEIRGQILPLPEPSAISLLAIAMLGLGAFGGRKRSV